MKIGRTASSIATEASAAIAIGARAPAGRSVPLSVAPAMASIESADRALRAIARTAPWFIPLGLVPSAGPYLARTVIAGRSIAAGLAQQPADPRRPRP